MGQKINPHGFRLGITTEYKSRWYADKLYKDYVKEDVINKTTKIALPKRIEGEYQSLEHDMDMNIASRYNSYDPDILENKDIFFYDILSEKYSTDKTPTFNLTNQVNTGVLKLFSDSCEKKKNIDLINSNSKLQFSPKPKVNNESQYCNIWLGNTYPPSPLEPNLHISGTTLGCKKLNFWLK